MCLLFSNAYIDHSGAAEYDSGPQPQQVCTPNPFDDQEKDESLDRHIL
jgi:hypothetical protein